MWKSFAAQSCFCLSIEPFPGFFVACHIHLSELAEDCENSPLDIHPKCEDCPAEWPREDAEFLSNMRHWPAKLVVICHSDGA